MKLVDKNSQIPLYTQLADIIKEMISSKELQEGYFLMSERDICKIQNISRMTVNKAIISLVNEGILERRQGKGTFVSYKKQKLTYEKMQGFTEIAENKKVKEYLNLDDDNSLVFQIERIRYIDDEPTILEKIYIPEHMCPTLNKKLVENNSIYKLYREKYFHKTQRAKQVINPVILNKSQAKTLNVDLNTLALKIDRVVFTDKNEILEYTSSLFTTDKHQYEIILNED